MSSHGHLENAINKKRCGGPAMCHICAREAIVALESGTLSREWQKKLALWALEKALRSLSNETRA